MPDDDPRRDAAAGRPTRGIRRRVPRLGAWCLAALLTSGSAHALDPVPTNIHDVNNVAGVMLGARHFAYEELNNGLVPTLPQVLDADRGWLPAFRVEGRLQRDLGGLRNAYLRATVEYAFGDLTYDGRTQPTALGGSVPVTRTSGAGIADLGVEAGVGLPLGSRWALTPLARYRFRYWARLLDKGQPGAFKEAYYHQELAAGGLGQVVIADGLVAGVAATLGGTVAPGWALQPSGSSARLRLDLGNALVARGEISLGYTLATKPRIHVMIGYELGTFAYGRSSTARLGTATAVEPDSRTIEQELRAGVAIGF